MHPLMAIDGPIGTAMAIDGTNGTVMAIDEMRWDPSTGWSKLQEIETEILNAVKLT